MSDMHVQIDQLRLSIGGVIRLNIPFLRLDPQGPTMILGPNGAGKSLFLRVLHALQTPDTGSVQVRHISGETARQAMVFQRPVLLRRSVRANLLFALSASGYARQTRAELAEKWMHQGKLAHLVDQPARRLSGGEQQRLSLVRALCCNPEILFLDEPCAHLDVNAAQDVEALIKSAIEAGIKVVMITHDRAQARRFGGEILLMEGGQVKAQEGAALFFGSSQNPWTQAFLQGYKISDTEAET